ncbi:MAG: hypothetical protein KJP06_07300 [Deltaproteobacteria bacterium]|nr:hypothetical protein [Deltaproteobacteria bacterium]
MAKKQRPKGSKSRIADFNPFSHKAAKALDFSSSGAREILPWRILPTAATAGGESRHHKWSNYQANHLGPRTQ